MKPSAAEANLVLITSPHAAVLIAGILKTVIQNNKAEIVNPKGVT